MLECRAGEVVLREVGVLPYQVGLSAVEDVLPVEKDADSAGGGLGFHGAGGGYCAGGLDEAAE